MPIKKTKGGYKGKASKKGAQKQARYANGYKKRKSSYK